MPRASVAAAATAHMMPVRMSRVAPNLPLTVLGHGDVELVSRFRCLPFMPGRSAEQAQTPGSEMPSLPKPERVQPFPAVPDRLICQTEGMDEARAVAVMAEAAAVLRNAGARFAYLYGSRAGGEYRPDSDIDIAAYFGGGQPPQAFDILLPSRVDLLVLDHAPLELAGRVAVRGRLLFEEDPVSRVRWEATTRKIYFDELPRITRAHREFAAGVTDRQR